MTDLGAQGAVYLPFSSRADSDIFIVARTAREPEAHAAALDRAVRSIDAELPLDGVRSMDARIADSLIARRSPALLIGIFAVVALVLAAVGTYGVLSYGVALRRREIGVRLALGAAPGQIGRQFLGLGLRFLAVGTILGIAGTLVAGRLMRGILFDVPVVHVAILGATTVILGIVSLIACVIPARRAAAVDPATVLGA